MAKRTTVSTQDAYALVLQAIDHGDYLPGDRLVESELAVRFGVSRTPIREALQRLETQAVLARDGRSLVVNTLDHGQQSDLYVVRGELEGLAARLAAQHATPEEIRVLSEMIGLDRKLMGKPGLLARANRRFHRQLHLASHNRYLVQQLEMVHRTMALFSTTSFAAKGRAEAALTEHREIIDAIAAHDGEAASKATRAHISRAYETRLRLQAEVAAK